MSADSSPDSLATDCFFTKYAGHDFWLGKLNQFNDEYINAEMVKAFMCLVSAGGGSGQQEADGDVA